MLERLGIRHRHELVTFVSLILLVAVTPTGKEATYPLVLALYRTLLLTVVVSYAVWADRSRLPRVSTSFLGAVVALIALMLISVVRWQGSWFEGVYQFYENVLFIAAFIALAHGALGRPAVWKHAILGSVVLIDVAYITAALLTGTRPILGPFVNANYLGSFMLPGLAICAATVLLASSTRLRIAAAATGLFLYYGIAQTSSRGATMAGLALLGLAGFRAARRRGASLLRIALAGSLLLALTAAFNPALVRKFFDMGQHDPYNYQRGTIWKGALAMIAQHPATGVGLGHFEYVAKAFNQPVETTITHYARWANIAHSEYLQYAAEIGIPGALLLFGLGAYLITLAWRRAGITAENGIVQEAALLTAAGLSIHALVDNNFTVPVLAAGLAVISQGDLLPFGGETLKVQRVSPVWRHAFGLVILAVWLSGALIPSIGLYFNEIGHEANAADDFKRAEFNHRLALAIIPDHPVLLDNLGTVYLDEFLKTRKREYLDRAETLFSDSMAENTDFDIPAGHLESALFQRLTQDPEKDRPIHRRIVETDQHLLAANPFNPFARKNLAEAYYNLGELDLARKELQKAIELEPNYVPAYLRLAEWYQESGQMEESARYRDHAIQVVNFYKDKPMENPFDDLLLGRPQSPGKP